MKQFNELIKNKLKDFDAPENPAAWAEFSKKIPASGKYSSGKIWMSGLAGMLLVALITGSILLWNNTPKQQNGTLQDNNAQIADNTQSDNNSSIDPTSISHTIIEGEKSNSNNTNQAKQINQPINNTQISNNSTQTPEDLQQETKTTGATNDNSQTISSNNQEQSSIKSLDNVVVNYNVLEICIPALVSFEVKHLPLSYTYCWITGNSKVCNQAYLENYYREPGNYSSSLEIFDPAGNMVKQISLNDFTVYPEPKANISFDNKNNLYTFSNLSESNMSTIWHIDNQVFTQSSLEYIFEKDGDYKVSLQVKNEAGCSDETYKKIDIVINHNYFVPTAFRPNSDGVNASFGPIGDNLFEYSFKMLIFDKTGTLIFESNNIDNLWNGKINGTGAMAESGVYTWEILTIDKNGTKKHNKGQVTLLKN